MDEFEELQRQRKTRAESSRFEAWDGSADDKPSLAVTSSAASLDLVMDIPVRISMEVGSAELSVRDLLNLNQGAVVELDRLAGEPLDVLVNGSLIAKGEVVIVNEQLGIRLTELASAADRVKSLRSEG
ncbi:MAG TPA: flagellar motor switch protein FliN [Spongiibacteraceae bacterium]|nr:flagellar motor switch protein FliN [Spongiibacteraceae bacterium]HCS28702.1 flagellar motor switch protein FliN [Spongiibacteraceae bacterium]